MSGLRKSAHGVRAATFLVLLATGVLIVSPALRARLLGGYGLQILAIHVWVGVAFTLATLPFVGLALRHAPRVGSRPALGTWRHLHLRFTVAATAALAASGFLLCRDGAWSAAAIDAASAAHRWLSVAAAGVLVVHLAVVAGRRLSARTTLRPPIGPASRPLPGATQ